MYLVASFKHNLSLELAFLELEQSGISRDKILAVPLQQSPSKYPGTVLRPDTSSQLDGSAVMGTALMALGVIYGYVLAWGPILWGLIGLFGGGALGFFLDYMIRKRRRGKRTGKQQTGEVILLIHCPEDLTEKAEEILWGYCPFGVARLILDKEYTG